MIKKEVFTGLFLGLLSNSIGICLVTLGVALFKKSNFSLILDLYYKNDNLWMLICLGSILNLIIFYIFLQKKAYYRARGVLCATFIAAISAYTIYFI